MLNSVTNNQNLPQARANQAQSSSPVDTRFSGVSPINILPYRRVFEMNEMSAAFLVPQMLTEQMQAYNFEQNAFRPRLASGVQVHNPTDQTNNSLTSEALQAHIAEVVCNFIPRQLIQHNKADLLTKVMDYLHNDPSFTSHSSTNTLVANAIEVGSNLVKEQLTEYNLIETKDVLLLKNNLSIYVADIIKLFFAVGSCDKSAIKNNAEQFISIVFASDKVAQLNPALFKHTLSAELTNALNNIINIHQSDEGGYLKFKSKAGDLHSLIKTQDSGLFELLGTLNPYDQYTISDQLRVMPESTASTNKALPMGHYKSIIGQGGFGKVRFARDLINGEIVVVKKLKSYTAYQAEVRQLARVGQSKHLISSLGHAMILQPDKAIKKGYIFMKYAGKGTGYEALRKMQLIDEKMREHFANNEPQAVRKYNDYKEIIFREFVKGAVYGLVELHAKGLSHRDVKPENIFGNEKVGFSLGDYGCATSQIQPPGPMQGTRSYLPPEVFLSHFYSGYDSRKHDSFSLGLSILAMRDAMLPTMKHHKAILNLDTGPYQLRLWNPNNKSVGQCLGVHLDTRKLAGKNLDEIIAKLLDHNPWQRISVQKAQRLIFG